MAGAMLQAALDYAAQGYPVLPCVPRGKIPYTPHGLKDASQEQGVIRGWLKEWPGANLAIRTDTLLVLDLDPGAGDWPGEERRVSVKALLPPLARTPRGGWHIWFSRPAGVDWRPSSSRLAPSVDVRTGPGSYVLVAPSATDKGKYHWIRPLLSPGELPVPPPWLCRELDSLVERRPVANDSTDGPLLLEGSRNEGLARLAGKLRRAGLSQSELEAALLAANGMRCRPPLQDKEVLAIARSISRYPPGPERDPPAIRRAWRQAISQHRRAKT
jgi:hypothetical protein